MIDICDFAVGLSRQLYGLTIATERPGHRMMETWHPLGVVGVITAFNFPGRGLGLERGAGAGLRRSGDLEAVGEDAAHARSPSSRIFAARRCERFGDAPDGLLQLVDRRARRSARRWSTTRDVPLVSATGSTAHGPRGRPDAWPQRFGRAILELGGNNAMIVAPSADLDLALRAIVFSAVGTAGQRCTTLRRLIVHEQRLRRRCCRA